MTTGKIKIKITGQQTAGEDTDITVSEAEGMCTKEAECYRLEYKEVMAEDMEADNVILVSPQKVSMFKKGAVETEMVFIPKERTGMEYKTPFGIIEMGIVCEAIELREERDEVVISYHLYTGEQLVADCNTRIEIANKKP